MAQTLAWADEGETMIETKDLQRLFVIDVHCLKCIRCCRYADALCSATEQLWSLTQNCYFEVAVINWCNVFGAYKEHTHFNRAFSGHGLVLRTGNRFSIKDVKSRIFGAAQMDEKEYARFHRNVVTCRDKFYVHTDLENTDPAAHPYTTVMMKTALEMRDIIHDVFHDGEYDDSSYGKSYRQYAESFRTGNDHLLKKLDVDVAKLQLMT